MMESSSGFAGSPAPGMLIVLRLLCRQRVLFPRAGVQNVVDFGKDQLRFFVAVVEMRRNADARLRAVIDQNIARQQFTADLERVRALDRYGPGPLARVLGRVYPPAAPPRLLPEPAGHLEGFFADGPAADGVQNGQARLASVERRNVRRAVQKTVRIVARIHGSRREGEWLPVRQPARQRRPQPRPQILAHVEIGDPGSAA